MCCREQNGHGGRDNGATEGEPARNCCPHDPLAAAWRRPLSARAAMMFGAG